MYLDLSDEEAAALTQELHEIVENDRYPFSPRIRTLKGILAKLRPEPAPRVSGFRDLLRFPIVPPSCSLPTRARLWGANLGANGIGKSSGGQSGRGIGATT